MSIVKYVSDPLQDGVRGAGGGWGWMGGVARIGEGGHPILLVQPRSRPKNADRTPGYRAPRSSSGSRVKHLNFVIVFL